MSQTRESLAGHSAHRQSRQPIQVRLLLDSSVLLAGCGSDRGVRREIFRLARVSMRKVRYDHCDEHR